MTHQQAYEKGAWDVFIHAGKQILPILNEVHVNGSWSEEKVEDFLKSRGLVKSLVDENYRERMIDAQHRAGALY